MNNLVTDNLVMVRNVLRLLKNPQSGIKQKVYALNIECPWSG